jgi:hypothetical protein
MTNRNQVLIHHQPAAVMWGRGGRDYDEVSFAISDSLAHAAQRLNARAGERILEWPPEPTGRLAMWRAEVRR